MKKMYMISPEFRRLQQPFWRFLGIVSLLLLILTVPVVRAQNASPCSLTVTASPTNCMTATNSYNVSGNIMLSNTEGGPATITDGSVTTTVPVAASATSVAYSLTGLVSDGESHTVTVTLMDCGSAVATYTAPDACTFCTLSATVIPGNVCSTVTPAITRGTAPYSYNWSGPTMNVVVMTKNATHPYAGVGFPAGYVIDGVQGKELTLIRGVTYSFNINAPNHPFVFTTSPAGGPANGTQVITTGVTNSGAVNGIVTFTPSASTPNLVYYNCGNHNNMGWKVNVVDQQPNGVLTGAMDGTYSLTVTDATNCSATTSATVNCLCSLSATATPTDCNPVIGTPTANQYTVTGTVVAINGPSAQSLTISVGSVGTTVNLTGNGPVSYTLSGLNSDGQVRTVTVMSSASACGMTSTTYAAPASCTLNVTAGLGDKVFEDLNANGIQDADPVEPGIANVTVTLASNGTTVTTTTNSSGIYSFMGLTPGVSYTATFTAPAGYSATGQNIGADDADSDGNPATGITGPYSLSANGLNPTVDMGYFRPASLGDKVFADNNSNGIQDTGDTPIAGVTVTLFINGVASATTTTASSGAVAGLYSFTGLTPGSNLNYSVGFGTPDGFTATSPLSGTDKTLDSDPVNGVTASITLASGENNLTLDAGFALLPVATFTVSSATVCAGNVASLSASGCAGAVAWSSGTNPASGTLVTVSTVSLSGITSQTVLSYTATCTVGNSATTAISTVTVNPQPSLTITASPGDMVRLGSSVTLTATGCNGGRLNWSTGDQNVSSVVVTAGNTAGSMVYSATCITPSGCTGMGAIEIMTIDAACKLAVTAVAGDCVPATNQYALTGSVSATGSTGNTSVTVSSGSQSVVLSLNGNGPVSYTLSGLVSGGSVQTVNVVSSASVCGSSSTTYAAPASCLVAPPGQSGFDITKVVNTSRARLGDVLNYTVTLVNTGTASGSVVATDVLDSKLAYVPNSATVSAGSYNNTTGVWTITSLPGNATATLTFSASVLAEGIVYNTASIDSKTVSVCTSIPVRVCSGSEYAFSLSVATGSSRYQWYKDDVLVQDNGVGVTGPAAYTGNTPNEFLVTSLGAYRVVVNEGVSGQCPDLSCCPFVVEEVIPVGLRLTTVAPTCTNKSPQNGKVFITGLGSGTANAGLTYQYSTGGTGFSEGSAIPVPAGAVPGGGEIVSNAVGGTTYFVRVFSPALADGTSCFIDLSVVVPVANCDCPLEICVPVSIRKTKSRTVLRMGNG